MPATVDDPSYQPERSLPAGARSTTVGERCIQLLEQLGVDTVFGIPGEHNLEFYRGLASTSIRHVSPRHEQGAGFMADGYARVSGRPGVCILIDGPGVTNAATAIASAYHDSQPLLLLSSAVPDEAQDRRGLIHQLPDQQALMSQLAAKSLTVGAPEQLPEALTAAWEVFESRRPRPVHIGIPTSVLKQPAPPATDLSRPTGRPLTPTVADIAEAASLLGSAQRPMILLGGGAVDAGTAAASIAERTSAPVVMTINAKGVLADDHPLSLGTTLALELVIDELEQSDVVLVVGSEFAEIDFYYSRYPELGATKVIQVDIDSTELGRCSETAVALQGDAAAVLAALDAALQRDDPRPPTPERAADIRSRMKWFDAAQKVIPVIDQIFSVLPVETIVAADASELAYIANHYAPAARPRSWLAAAGFGSLGVSLPMAIGAKIADPERPVVVLVGDGGLLFTLQELGAAADLGLDIAVLLWRNGGYGAIREAMDGASIPRIGTEVTARDFESISQGFGCRFVRTSIEDVDAGLAAALEGSGPVVVEVVVAS